MFRIVYSLILTTIYKKIKNLKIEKLKIKNLRTGAIKENVQYHKAFFI